MKALGVLLVVQSLFLSTAIVGFYAGRPEWLAALASGICCLATCCLARKGEFKR